MSPGNRRPPDGQKPGRPGTTGQEVIFEFTRVGDQTRVAAVDPASGAEAVVFGPAGTPQADLERLALSKLRYVMGERRRRDEKKDPGPGRLV